MLPYRPSAGGDEATSTTATAEYAAGEGEKSELLLFKTPSSEIESPTTITPPFQQTLRVFVTNGTARLSSLVRVLRSAFDSPVLGGS